jgi:uncharacterized protein YdbL (DUF1318 family)
MMTRTLGPAATKIADSLRSALGPRAVFEVRELDHGGQIRVNVRGLQTTFGYLAWVGNEEQEDRTEEFVTKIIEARACAFAERAAIIAESMQLSRADAERMAAEQMELTDDEIEFLQGSGK